jgi:hypothetical protein
MPNWCYNSATFVCPSRDTYHALLQSIKDNKWFQTFAPLGKDAKSDDSDDYYEQDLACEKWGTKWVPSNIEINDEDDSTYTIDISFETAWNPPGQVYRTMNENYSIKTTAYYYELNCDFFGRYVYSDEQEIDEVYDIPSNQKDLVELQNNIDSDLNDYMMCIWDYIAEQWEDE